MKTLEEHTDDYLWYHYGRDLVECGRLATEGKLTLLEHHANLMKAAQIFDDLRFDDNEITSGIEYARSCWPFRQDPEDIMEKPTEKLDDLMGKTEGVDE